MAIFGAIALILFGPERLPKVARKVGHVMRDIQNTSQAFISEMERAAEEPDGTTAPSFHDQPDTMSYADPFATSATLDEPPASAAVPASERSGGDRPPHARPASTPEYRVD
jgi:sec-independent protein translocase protein TatA